MMYQFNKAFAEELDSIDTLKKYREEFNIPLTEKGELYKYFVGNSLGLQSKRAVKYVNQLMDDWGRLGVDGWHIDTSSNTHYSWLEYSEKVSKEMANIVGAKPEEVIVMNTLTVNLHLLMVSFYKPTKTKYKIIIDYNAFPSDRYALVSHLKYRGYDENALIELKPKQGNDLISDEEIKEIIEREGDSVALILMAGVNYYSGQLFPLKNIVEWGHAKGCIVGFDLAHVAGNVNPNLHSINADFAAWCSYKYLNSGPGSLGGVFIHEKYGKDQTLNRFAGWWGNDIKTRFKMPSGITYAQGAAGWQLSTPTLIALAPIRASVEIFNEAGFDNLIKKSKLLTGFLEYCLNQIPNTKFTIITSTNPEQRGCQLSIRIAKADKKVFYDLHNAGILTDWREPDVIRLAPVPLYNSFMDVFQMASTLKKIVTA